jgi:hypothetical protein
LYREEDDKFGVRYQNGVLQNKEYPLNPKFGKAPAQSLMSNSTFSHLSSSKNIFIFLFLNFINSKEHLKPLICNKPEKKKEEYSTTHKLKENFNPLSKSQKFKFTGKTDFLSQIKKVKQLSNTKNLTYLNGQLIQKDDMIQTKTSTNETNNEELKSYNMTPCKWIFNTRYE